MNVKVIGIIGPSGSGKTTLVEALIARFGARGLRVAAIKHAHEGFDLDRPGKDSYRFRTAGACQVLLASPRRWALLSEEEEGGADGAGALARHLARLAPCDLVLVEGFRAAPGLDTIEVRRGGIGDADARPSGRLVARATDAAAHTVLLADGLPRFDLDDVEGIAAFIASHLDLPPC